MHEINEWMNEWDDNHLYSLFNSYSMQSLSKWVGETHVGFNNCSSMQNAQYNCYSCQMAIREYSVACHSWIAATIAQNTTQQLSWCVYSWWCHKKSLVYYTALATMETVSEPVKPLPEDGSWLSNFTKIFWIVKFYDGAGKASVLAASRENFRSNFFGKDLDTKVIYSKIMLWSRCCH